MGDDHKPNVRIYFESFFKRNRVHIPCVAFRVDEDGFTIFVGHRIYGCIERNIGAEDTVSLECPLIGTCLSI